MVSLASCVVRLASPVGWGGTGGRMGCEMSMASSSRMAVVTLGP